MKVVKFEIEGTRFECHADPDALAGSELTGDSEFLFPGELGFNLSQVIHEMTSFGGSVSQETLGQQQESRTGNRYTDDGEPLRLDVDSGIAAIAYLIDLGNKGEEPWVFEWEGSSGSLFWLFHDMSHAEHDWCADADSQTIFGPAEISGQDEDRANVDGAKAALAAGDDPSKICEELVSFLTGFKSRFGFDSTALADVLESGAVPVGKWSEEEEYRDYVLGFAQECADGDLNGYAYTPEFPSFPNWAILLHSDARDEWKEIADHDMSIRARAYFALVRDVESQAWELQEKSNDED